VLQVKRESLLMSRNLLPLLASAGLARGALLDPLTMTQNKASQPTVLRPYLPVSANAGLATATLALG